MKIKGITDTHRCSRGHSVHDNLLIRPRLTPQAISFRNPSHVAASVLDTGLCFIRTSKSKPVCLHLWILNPSSRLHRPTYTTYQQLLALPLPFFGIWVPGWKPHWRCELAFWEQSKPIQRNHSSYTTSVARRPPSNAPLISVAGKVLGEFKILSCFAGFLSCSRFGSFCVSSLLYAKDLARNHLKSFRAEQNLLYLQQAAILGSARVQFRQS